MTTNQGPDGGRDSLARRSALERQQNEKIEDYVDRLKVAIGSQNSVTEALGANPEAFTLLWNHIGDLQKEIRALRKGRVE